LAKHVFQVHGVDASGAVVLRKRLRRSQVVAFFAGLPRCVRERLVRQRTALAMRCRRIWRSSA
jgi:hypothetical protein